MTKTTRRYSDSDMQLDSSTAERGTRGVIKWPTDREIRSVSKALVELRTVGIDSESKGEYLKSGNLAYELQQIIQETAKLCRRNARVASSE